MSGPCVNFGCTYCIFFFFGIKVKAWPAEKVFHNRVWHHSNCILLFIGNTETNKFRREFLKDLWDNDYLIKSSFWSQDKFYKVLITIIQVYFDPRTFLCSLTHLGVQNLKSEYSKGTFPLMSKPHWKHLGTLE